MRSDHIWMSTFIFCVSLCCSPVWKHFLPSGELQSLLATELLQCPDSGFIGLSLYIQTVTLKVLSVELGK
jgi:hypothetical protein